MSVQTGLISDMTLDAMDDAVFLAGRDTKVLPQVERDLVGLQAALQMQLKQFGTNDRSEVAAVLERIKKTLWHVSLLVDYYDRVAVVEAFDQPTPDMRPAPVASALPDLPPHHAVDVLPAEDDAQPGGGQAPATAVRATPAEPVDIASDAATAQYDVSGVRAADRTAAATSLCEIDRDALLDALRLGPAADRRSPYTATPRSKESSIHRLLVERFQVDPLATYAILDALISEGAVAIRMRGLPPQGKTCPCIVVR